MQVERVDLNALERLGDKSLHLGGCCIATKILTGR
jgi:hypothetical protein